MKSASEHFHHFFSSLLQTLILEISSLEICWISGLFCNTLTANDKYTVRDCVNMSSPIQMELSLKPAIFPDVFVPFLEYTSDCKHFVKKRSSPCLLCLGIYTLWNSWLDHSLKKTVSDIPLRINMLKSPKLLGNVHQNTFIIIFHHYTRPWLWKYLT